MYIHMYICMYIYIYIIVYSTISPFSEMVVPSAVHLSICRRVPVAEGETDLSKLRQMAKSILSILSQDVAKLC